MIFALSQTLVDHFWPHNLLFGSFSSLLGHCWAPCTQILTTRPQAPTFFAMSSSQTWSTSMIPLSYFHTLLTMSGFVLAAFILRTNTRLIFLMVQRTFSQLNIYD